MKDFVPHDLSSALLNLGFDADDYFGFWNLFDYSNEWKLDARIQYDCIHYVGAPLYQQAFRFFREKYNMPSKIEATSEHETPNQYHYFYQIVTDDFVTGDGVMLNWTYEEAEVSCLKKLIEIVKNK
jgi:hypothetical protein